TCCDANAAFRPPIRSCSGSSLPRFTPACAGIVTVALVLASRRTGVTREPALWSSDFPRTPPFDDRVRGRLAASRDDHCSRIGRLFGLNRSPDGSPRARSGTPPPNALDGDRNKRRTQNDGTDISVPVR